EQVRKAIEYQPDFVELRLDIGHDFDLRDVSSALTKAGIASTIHLPSNPDWKPAELSQGMVPYIDLGRLVDAELVTFHTSLSTLFYSDEDIEVFLESLPIAYDASLETGVPLAIETRGLYYTELSLLFERFPKLGMVLDIGHGEILALRNRSLTHIDSFYKHIDMVNVHDNNGSQLVQEILDLRKKRTVSIEEMRELARRYDTHDPIGSGSIDFDAIFSRLKTQGYDKKFLMLGGSHDDFPQERKSFMNCWLAA
ncbi:sugar phosphate isomerase/epimerase, partial [Candidatus Thorarchaeota archaeon]